MFGGVRRGEDGQVRGSGIAHDEAEVERARGRQSTPQLAHTPSSYGLASQLCGRRQREHAREVDNVEAAADNTDTSFHRT